MAEVGQIVDVLLGGFMVFAPVLPYLPQSYMIFSEKNSGGFSPHICLILLLANILRIFFWYGERFGLALLFQSVVMIATQLLMLLLWFSYKTPCRNSNFLKNFWDWDEFIKYGNFLSFIFGTFVKAYYSDNFSSACFDCFFCFLWYHNPLVLWISNLCECNWVFCTVYRIAVR